MGQLPDKLYDSYSHGSGTELFVVEGDSAALSLDRIRNRERQAVLPMQGKPMNAIKASLNDIRRNAQFAALLTALGVDSIVDWSDDQTSPNTEFDFKALRYERVVLLFDPDADGIHSRTLVLLFFYRWLRPYLDAGNVLAAYPPLWKVTAKGLDEPVYAYTQSHLDRVRKQLESNGNEELEIKRYRGLSNHRGETISRLCVDSKTRQVSTLSSADAESALQMFEQMRDATRKL